MSTDTQALLVELLTEELPPKALPALGQAFAHGIYTSLQEQGLVAADNTFTPYATPRRLAVYIPAVYAQAQQRHYRIKLMPVNIGLDANGQATPALRKKLQAQGLEHLQVEQLERAQDGKQEQLYASGSAAGAKLAQGLQQALDTSLTQLPIPKLMQYQLADGHTSVKFVRPAHGLLALWGDSVIRVRALGLQAGNTTAGHRFMDAPSLAIKNADSWCEQLAEQGQVIASFAQRRQLINTQLNEQAQALAASIGSGPEVEALLDEVCALVEFPTTYVGSFDPEFLAVPPECLILTMRLNQKYFPLFDPHSGKLRNQFLIVSNMRPANPANIIEGNERVIYPRLADAQFFYQTDLKTPLAQRVDQLAQSVYHHKLGNQLQRSERVQQNAAWLARLLDADSAIASRAARLAHADLSTLMVGEFPELQGIMGAYYAQHDGEPAELVRALRTQYQIRLQEPVNGASLIAAILFMAERAETLIGAWGVGLIPTGERDPYGLRRAALGLISAYQQLLAGGYLSASQSSAIGLHELLQQAASTFAPGTLAANTVAAVQDFIYERLRHQLSDQASKHVVDAVLALSPPLHQVELRIQACNSFMRLPEAEALASANKRIGNLLKKADQAVGVPQQQLLQAGAEQNLATKIQELGPLATQQFNAGEFAASLATLAQTRAAVNEFFADVMVMADDPAIRANRLALLASLHQLMNQVADLSRLAH